MPYGSRIAPHATLEHINRPDWLERARNGDSSVRAECIAAFSRTGPGLCTCTTFGPFADQAGITRIDRPMIERAAKQADKILLAYTVPSTAQTSAALLNECIGIRPVKITLISIHEAWPHFESGDECGYTKTIAQKIRINAMGHDCILLGQASMEVAMSLLHDLSLSTPAETAFKAVLFQ